MKLKSIMYALGYGKSRKSLVRSEGARRVKQAEVMSYRRGIALRDKASTVICMSKGRSQERTETFKHMFGSFQAPSVNTGLQQHAIYESVKRGDKIGITFLED